MTKEEILETIMCQKCWYKKVGISRQNAYIVKRIFHNGEWKPIHDKILKIYGYKQIWCKKNTGKMPGNEV